MRKLLLLLACLPLFCHASSSDELKQKLSEWNGFSAQFSQKTYSFDGELVQEGEGQILLTKPDLFKWHTQRPDEMLIQSDGETIWVLNPLLESVTLYSVSQFEDTTPLTLLATDDDKVWENYQVVIEGSKYRLVSQVAESSIEYFELSFDQAALSGFVIVDRQGQRSEFNLANFKALESEEKQNFVFQIPPDVDVDDQREQ